MQHKVPANILTALRSFAMGYSCTQSWKGGWTRDAIEGSGRTIACISIITVASSDKVKERTEEGKNKKQKAKSKKWKGILDLKRYVDSEMDYRND